MSGFWINLVGAVITGFLAYDGYLANDIGLAMFTSFVAGFCLMGALSLGLQAWFER